MSSVNAAGAQSNKRLIALVLAVIGVLFVILGVVYLTVSAGSLPGFLGHINGSTGHHKLRMTASFVVGIVCLVAAWFVSRGGRSAGSTGASTSADASAHN